MTTSLPPAPPSAPASPPASSILRAEHIHIFSWVFLSALLARLWRAFGLWQEADANDGFVWLPLGLAADALFASLIALVVWAIARRWPRAGMGAGLALGFVHIGWLGLNLVSFTLTQAPITFQRARGDEGVALDAHALLRWEDVIPAIAFGVFALAALPVAFGVRSRLAGVFGAVVGERVGRGRAAAAAVAACALLYASDALWFRERNFGVADHPAFTLVSSFVLGAFDEVRKPALKDKPATDAAARQQLLDSLLVARTPAVESAPPSRARDSVQNVIVIFSEGISREHTSLPGAAGADVATAGSTPHLARRAAQDGLDLTRYHSTYHKSIAAIYSLACADFPPPNGQNIVEINARIDCGEMSDVLSAHGLRTGLFHGGDFGFYDKLMLLGMRHWDITADARVMSNPLLYEENEWGIDDRAGVDAMLAWIDTLPPGQRFASVFIPITAHWPFWIPTDVEPLLPGISSKNKFLNAVHFLDGAFEQLMVGLEERGLADDTAVIYLADHGETVGERPRASAGRRLAYQPSLHVPLVILAPGMWPRGATTDRLGSHVDLVPTVLDLLGLPPDARHRGTSLLAPDRAPPRVFIGASNGPKWVGWLDGTQKFVVNRTTGMREAYDLARDPDERRNIVSELPAAQVDELEQDALLFAEAQMLRLAAAPKVDAELDIEKLFYESVQVRVRRGATVIPCVPTLSNVPGTSTVKALAGPRACGDEGEIFLGRQSVRDASEARHECILARAPRDGVLEMEVKDQRWLPLITRARVAQTPERRGEGVDSPSFEVWSDGTLEGRRELRTNDGHVRLPMVAPRENLLMRLGGEGPGKRDVCITITERAWRNRPVSPRK